MRRYRTATIACCALFLAAAAWVPAAAEEGTDPTPNQIREWMLRAQTRIGEGDLDGAATLLLRIRDNDPGYPETQGIREQVAEILDRIAAGRPIPPHLAGVPAAPGGSGPSNEHLDRMNRELDRHHALESERQRVLGRNHFQSGRTYEEQGKFAMALEQYQRAAAYGHPGAEEAAVEMRRRLGLAPDEYGAWIDRLTDLRRAQIEQRRHLIHNLFVEGIDHLAGNRFDRAVEIFQRAKDIIRALEYSMPGRQELLERADALIEETGAREREHDLRIREQIGGRIREEETAREQGEHRRMLERLHERVSEVRDHFARENYREVERLAGQVLDQAPPEPFASELRWLRSRAMQERHRDDRRRSGRDHIEQWRNVVDMTDETIIPRDPRMPLQFPENWREISALRGGIASEIEEPLWKQQLRRQLNQSVSGANWEDFNFGQVRQFLSSNYNLTLQIDPRSFDPNDIDQILIDFKFDQPMRMEMVLENLVAKLSRETGEDLRWTLREGGVTFTSNATVSDELVYRTYDVRDLTLVLTDFVGPEVSLAVEEGATIGAFEEPREIEWTPDDIQLLIEEQVQPDFWQTVDGASANVTPAGLIIVRATPEVHQEVEKLLSALRSQRQLQVTVQARFITLNDVQIDELGVSWSGLPGRTVDLGGGNVGNAGIANPIGRRSDVRFIGHNPNTNPPLPLLNTSPFVNSPSNLGRNAQAGFATSFFNWTYLNDWQVSMFLSMLHMTERGTVVSAPILTAFNTQRAHMMVLTQQAYIRDYTLITNQGIAAADPELGYLQLGVVFDVRPVVSADRKYVTLEVRPSVASLVTLRQIEITPAPLVTVTLEAPTIQLQAFRTTVAAPDGGTLLMGGLTQFNEMHQYSGLPMISKIPILNFLFGRDQDIEERSNLVVLIKTQILDQEEIERRVFGEE